MNFDVNLDFIKPLVADAPMPKLVRLEQSFDDTHIEPADMESKAYADLLNNESIKKIKPGQSIAITCGSRGISGYVEMTRAAVRAVKAMGGEPFLVPSMGSHAGASAEGQKAMVENLGCTFEAVGAPIKSSMEVDQIATVMGNRPVFIDRNAHNADGIILINRVKCHTGFRGTYESGLMKMMAIGLGKQHGASHYHQTGYAHMAQAIEEVGKAVIANAKILCGIASVENTFGHSVNLEVVDAKDIPDREAELLKLANSYMPSLYWKDVDVILIKEIGKNISGTGFDHNVAGRFPDHPEIALHSTKMILTDITPISHGNCSAMGRADIITRNFVEKIDLSQAYPNAITSTSLDGAKMPLVVNDDETALKTAIKTSLLEDFTKVRLAIIENTKHIETVYASENLVDEAVSKGARVASEPFDIPFDEKGNLKLDF